MLSPSLLPSIPSLHRLIMSSLLEYHCSKSIWTQPSSIHPFWVFSILSGGWAGQKGETLGSSPSASLGVYDHNIQSCLPSTSRKSGVGPQECRWLWPCYSRTSVPEGDQAANRQPSRARKSQQHGELRRRHALCS